MKITLLEYLNFGGRLDKVKWSEAYSDYGDKNRLVPIISYEDKGDKNPMNDTPLIYFTFENGNTHRYAISWIMVNVNFELSPIYKKA